MTMNIEKKREQLKKAIDKLDANKIDNHYEKIMNDLIPEVDEELTEEDWREVQEAKERIKNGEYVTLEELLKVIDGEDDV